jgi:hypothetical protein
MIQDTNKFVIKTKFLNFPEKEKYHYQRLAMISMMMIWSKFAKSKKTVAISSLSNKRRNIQESKKLEHFNNLRSGYR